MLTDRYIYAEAVYIYLERRNRGWWNHVERWVYLPFVLKVLCVKGSLSHRCVNGLIQAASSKPNKAANYRPKPLWFCFLSPIYLVFFFHLYSHFFSLSPLLCVCMCSSSILLSSTVQLFFHLFFLCEGSFSFIFFATWTCVRVNLQWPMSFLIYRSAIHSLDPAPVLFFEIYCTHWR